MDNMNSRERTLAVIEGKLPDRVPVCLHNFMMATPEAGARMEDYLRDPETAARVHLEAQARYGYDCILIDLDTTMLAEAMGAEVDCTPGEPGHVKTPAITSLDEAAGLPRIDPRRAGRIPVLLEAVRIMRREVGDKVAIRGNCDQMAFSLASLLRGMQDFMMDLVTEPDHPGLQALLQISFENHLAVHRAVIEAGADFTSLGDSPCGPDMVSPALFRQFARPWHERLLADLARDGIYTVIHICGNTTAILDDLAGYGRCGFDLDYKTDAARAKRGPGASHVLCGNLDPSSVVGRGTVEQVEKATRALFETWKPGGRFILNAGCAIPAGTPPANIEAMMTCARELGRYAN